MHKKPFCNSSEQIIIVVFACLLLVGIRTQSTCSRANCASCGSVGPCGQCNKGYQLDNGGCKAQTSRQEEEQQTDPLLLVVTIFGCLIFVGIVFWIGTCCYNKKNQQANKKVAGQTTNLSTSPGNNDTQMQPTRLYAEKAH